MVHALWDPRGVGCFVCSELQRCSSTHAARLLDTHFNHLCAENSAPKFVRVSVRSPCSYPGCGTCKLKYSNCQIQIPILDICICLFLKQRLVQSCVCWFGTSLLINMSWRKLTLHPVIVKHVHSSAHTTDSSLLWADIAQDVGDWLPGSAPSWSPTLALSNKTWLTVVRFLPKVVVDPCGPVRFDQQKIQNIETFLSYSPSTNRTDERMLSVTAGAFSISCDCHFHFNYSKTKQFIE